MNYLKKAKEVIRDAVINALTCERVQKDSIAKAHFKGQADGLATAYNLFVHQAGLKDEEETALLLSLVELGEEVNAKFEKAKQ